MRLNLYASLEHYAGFTGNARAQVLAEPHRLGNAVDRQRISETGQYGQGEDESECGSEMIEHGYTRCRALTAISMTLIPAKGRIRPPTP